MTSTEVSAPAVAARPADLVAGHARIQSVDALRGAIMMLMAIDHVRDFFHSGAMSFSPTDLSWTTAAIFFTRWITHFCAPVFAFTAGIGAFFWVRKRTKPQLSRFLLTRGLWLMLLEVTVIRFILTFEVGVEGKLIILTVFWMLGLCMMVLAALVYLPARLLLVLSIAVIAAHNLMDSVRAACFGSAAWLWDILHQQGLFNVGGAGILVAYPLIPWVAVMAAGYCLGPVLVWEPARRRRFLLRLGLALSLAFVLLRALNRYGDPQPWSTQPSWVFTVLSFLNTTKYPPSLQFLLMTLGPALLAMGWLDRIRFSAANLIIVFGRVPFFFFLLHLAVIHALAIALNLVRYGRAPFLLMPAPSMGGPREMFPADYGFNLGAVYLVWVAVIVLAYPACRWYSQLKQRHSDWWLSYL
jgi:uncharacterized membrane protein